jgi:hypothetical protein
MAVGEGTRQFLLAYPQHQSAPVSYARGTFPGRDGSLSDETGRPMESYDGAGPGAGFSDPRCAMAPWSMCRFEED